MIHNDLKELWMYISCAQDILINMNAQKHISFQCLALMITHNNINTNTMWGVCLGFETEHTPIQWE